MDIVMVMWFRVFGFDCDGSHGKLDGSFTPACNVCHDLSVSGALSAPLCTHVTVELLL